MELDNEQIVKTLENVVETNLQNGIIIKALSDILVDKKIVSNVELEGYIIKITKEVQKEIKKLEQDMSDIENYPTNYFGKGGDA